MQMLKFGPSSRDRLFYDKYEYGICVSIVEGGILRAKTLKELNSAINYRNQARAQYWGTKSSIDGKVKDNLLAVWHELDAVRDSIKIVASYNILYIYSNDTSVLEHLANLQEVKYNIAVQAIVNKPRDVILKTNPKFKFRSYFKDRSLTEIERDRLLEFIKSREDSFGVTTYFKDSLSRYTYHWLQRHQFVEHNDPKDITMLSLVVPGLIRKTLRIQAK